MTYYCKAPAPLKAENVGNPLFIGVCSNVLPFLVEQFHLFFFSFLTNDLLRFYHADRIDS